MAKQDPVAGQPEEPGDFHPLQRGRHRCRACRRPLHDSRIRRPMRPRPRWPSGPPDPAGRFPGPPPLRWRPAPGSAHRPAGPATAQDQPRVPAAQADCRRWPDTAGPAATRTSGTGDRSATSAAAPQQDPARRPPASVTRPRPARRAPRSEPSRAAAPDRPTTAGQQTPAPRPTVDRADVHRRSAGPAGVSRRPGRSAPACRRRPRTDRRLIRSAAPMRRPVHRPAAPADPSIRSRIGRSSCSNPPNGTSCSASIPVARSSCMPPTDCGNPIEQRGFTDAGLAGEDEHATLTDPDTRQQRLDDAALGLPPDEHAGSVWQRGRLTRIGRRGTTAVAD